MKGKNTLSGLFILVFVLSVASAVVSTWMRAAHDLVVEAEEARRQVHRLSNLTRQSTDDLTRMVRLYAATGEPRYLAYFREILDIRNGEAPRPEDYEAGNNYWDHVLATGERPSAYGPAVALRALLRDSGFTGSEMALLERSEDLSNELVLLEEDVIAIVGERIESGGGDYVLDGAAVEGLMRLHSEEYHKAKLKILEPLAELAEAFEQRVQTEVDSLQARHKQLGNIQMVLAGLSALLMVVAVVVRIRER